MVDLEDWSVEVRFVNPFSNTEPANVLIDSAEIIFYANPIEDMRVKMYVNGMDTRHYGMFIESVDIPTGLKSDVKYLDIDGSDINTAYRQNIDKKEITVKFNIIGCTIEETTSLLKMLGKLLTNKRDSMNDPIPNQVQFSHYPDEYWDVIMEDPIDSDVEAAMYSSTLKLVVPDGTSYQVEDTVTSNIGTCGSIAKVNPVITFIPTTLDAESYVITELQSNQSMVIKYNKFVEGDICELDCKNRKLILKTYNDEIKTTVNVDISEYVDWASDWFVLDGDYNFQTTDCMIQTVAFNERG